MSRVSAKARLAEVAYEHRIGEIGVITLTGFHHWINDVEDLLPIGGIKEWGHDRDYNQRNSLMPAC